MRIIVDTELPGMMGFEIIAKNRKDEEALQKIANFLSLHKESKVAIIMARSLIEKGGIVKGADFILEKQ